MVQDPMFGETRSIEQLGQTLDIYLIQGLPPRLQKNHRERQLVYVNCSTAF
jgi:hypothetical protein